jgi:hypothetical protein
MQITCRPTRKEFLRFRCEYGPVLPVEDSVGGQVHPSLFRTPMRDRLLVASVIWWVGVKVT